MKSKNVIIMFVIMFIAISSLFYMIVQVSVSKYNGYTIVIDAGHGGRDGGSVGIGGTIEKEINLKYSLALKEVLQKNGFRVVLTRKNDDGLYSAFDKNKKSSDMKQRFKIISEANPNLVVSIHMNSFSDSSACGATTYFRKNDKASEACADLVQKSLNKNCGAKVSKAKVGDYYMLNCSYYTAILVECGFISNEDEEKKLNTKDYMNNVVNSIYKGIFLYFGNTDI